MSNLFSKNLKYLRERKHISKSKLGELVGVNQSTIGRWENGEITPSIDNVEEVAKALHIDLPDLLIKDLSIGEKAYYDELFFLFNSNRDILTEDDKEYMKFIIEKRKKDCIPNDLITYMEPRIAETGIVIKDISHTNMRALLVRVYLEIFSKLQF